MPYIDSYVVPVPKARLEEYREIAQLSQQVWMDHGALEYRESVAEDVKPGEHTSFPQAVQLQDDEVVVIGTAVFRHRQHRDRVNEKVFDDPRFADMDMKNMPFDGKRMFWGGFEPLVWSDES